MGEEQNSQPQQQGSQNIVSISGQPLSSKDVILSEAAIQRRFMELEEQYKSQASPNPFGGVIQNEFAQKAVDYLSNLKNMAEERKKIMPTEANALNETIEEMDVLISTLGGPGICYGLSNILAFGGPHIDSDRLCKEIMNRSKDKISIDDSGKLDDTDQELINFLRLVYQEHQPYQNIKNKELVKELDLKSLESTSNQYKFFIQGHEVMNTVESSKTGYTEFEFIPTPTGQQEASENNPAFFRLCVDINSMPIFHILLSIKSYLVSNERLFFYPRI